MTALPEKFPVWQTAMDSLDYCWRHRHLAVRFGWIPFTVALLASWALVALDVSMSEPSVELFAIAFLQILIFLAPTVTWYRLVAYGEQEAGARPAFTLGRLEIRLLLWQILFVFGLIIPFGIAGGAVAGIGALVRTYLGDVAAIVVSVPLVAALVLAFAVTATRLTMILALASLDEPTGFKAAWEVTRGIAWRLTGALLILVLAIVLLLAAAELMAWLLGMIIAITAGVPAAGILPYARVPAQEVVNFVALLAIATLFGLAYKMRARLVEATAEPPGPIPVT